MRSGSHGILNLGGPGGVQRTLSKAGRQPGARKYWLPECQATLAAMTAELKKRKAMWSAEAWEAALLHVARVNNYNPPRAPSTVSAFIEIARDVQRAANDFNTAYAAWKSLPSKKRGAPPTIHKRFADNPQAWCGMSGLRRTAPRSCRLTL